MTTSRTTARPFERVLAPARAALDWLDGAPASIALAVLTVAVGVPAQLWPDALAGLAAAPADPTRVWTLLTSTVWVGSWGTLVGAVVVWLTLGAWTERSLGARRYLVAGLACAAGGILVVQALHPVLAGLIPAWGRHISSTVIGSGGAVVLGALAAASARLDVLWRRRVRTLLLVGLGTIVAFGGGAGDLVGLGAALVGLLAGHLAWRAEAPHRSLVGTRQDARVIVAIVVVAVTLGTLASAWSTFPVGPLAAVRFGLEPDLLDAPTIAALCADPDTVAECARATFAVRTRGWAPSVLAAMPLLVQLVLAAGLHAGRRAAAWGTIALQAFSAALGLVHLVGVWIVVRASGESAGPLGLGPHGVPGPRLAVPILVPLALAVLVLLTRRAFPVRTRPGTMRRLATAVLLTTTTAFGLVLAVGLAFDEQFVPSAEPSLLAIDVGVRLLPSGAPALLAPTLEPLTPLAVVVTMWAPILVWVVAAVALWVALRGNPATRDGGQAALTALVRQAGAGTLGWMLTWPGRDAWIDAAGCCGVGYRAGSGVALTVTDPAAAPCDLRAAVIEFATFASAHSLIPALYSVHDPVAAIARDLGWTTVQVAEEAILDLPGLAFTGKAFQDIRTALNRAGKEGITPSWTTWAACPAGQRDQIAAIGAAWLADKSLPEMGFTLGGMAELADADTRLLLAVDAAGTVHGVTSWMPVHGDGAVVGLTLDVMWRRHGGFRSTMEFLIARAALDAQAEGLQVLSLSGSPLARSGRADAVGEGTASRLDPVLEQLGALLEPVYGFRSLLAFKAKFGPRFEPLYLAVPDLMDAPAVGLAVARAYLPDLGAADAARFATRLVTRD